MKKNNVTLSTSDVAALIGVTEGEVVFALKTGNKVKGVELPKKVNGAGVSRRFYYEDIIKAIEFAKCEGENID